MSRKKREHRFHTQTFSIDDATEEQLNVLVADADMPISRYIRKLIRLEYNDYQKRCEQREEQREHEKIMSNLDKQILEAI